MTEGKERQKLLATRGVTVQESRMASAQGRSRMQYGRHKILKQNSRSKGLLRKPTETPAASVKVADLLPVLMEDIRLEAMHSVSESGKEGEYA